MQLDQIPAKKAATAEVANALFEQHKKQELENHTQLGEGLQLYEQVLKDGVSGGQLAIMQSIEAIKKRISKYASAHEYEIASTFTDADWLEVYSDLIAKGHADMDLLVKASTPWDDYKALLDRKTAPQADMASELEAAGLTWQ